MAEQARARARNEGPVVDPSPVTARPIARYGPMVVLRRLVRERSWRELQWPVLGMLGFLAIVLGSIGYWQHYQTHGVAARRPWDILFRDLQLFGFSVDTDNEPLPVALELARWLAPFVAGYTALFALYNVFRARIKQMRLPFLHGHVVVCGLGEKGMLFAHSLIANSRRVVVIERDRANEHIQACEEAASTVLIGDGRDSQLLRQARVPEAGHLIVVCNDDGVNTEITLRARELVARHRDRNLPALNCITHLVDGDRAALLRARELAHPVDARFRLDFFNVDAAGAYEILEEFPPDGEPPHLLLVGAGAFTEWLAVYAAQQWARSRRAGGRPRITVLDHTADRQVELIGSKHPQIGGTCDLIALPMPVEYPEAVAEQLLTTSPVTRAYVCHGDDGAGLSAALTLRNHVLDRSTSIVVCMTRVEGLAMLLESGAAEASGLGRIDGFSLLERTCDPEVLLSHAFEVYARAAHNDYCEQERAKSETPESNPSIRPFEELAPDTQEQNRSQAADVGRKLREIGCTIVPRRDWTAPEFALTFEELERLSRLEHERYVELALAQGWRHGAGPKGSTRKTNPTLVSWEDLSEQEREKDRNAIRNIPKILARLGLQIMRVEGMDKG